MEPATVVVILWGSCFAICIGTMAYWVFTEERKIRNQHQERHSDDNAE